MCSLIWAWIDGCVNNREAGDLRRHGAYYDVTLMWRPGTWRWNLRVPDLQIICWLDFKIEQQNSSPTIDHQMIWTIGFIMSHQVPDSKVYGANMGPIWDRQDPGGPHDGPINIAVWDIITNVIKLLLEMNVNFIWKCFPEKYLIVESDKHVCDQVFDCLGSPQGGVFYPVVSTWYLGVYWVDDTTYHLLWQWPVIRSVCKHHRAIVDFLLFVHNPHVLRI